MSFQESIGRRILCLILVTVFLFVAQGGNGYSTAVANSPQLVSNVYYVTPNGNDHNDCGAQGDPCKTLQYAVNEADSGSTIYVAAGTYTYTFEECNFLVTRAVVCLVDKHLTILGGYSADWSGPNPGANPTVIDGQNSKRGVAIIAYNSTASLRMEGFTIQNGLAQGNTENPERAGGRGGGIWAQNGSVNLKNVVLKNNRAIGGNLAGGAGGAGTGGGLAVESSKNGAISTLENVSFIENQAVGGGGPERGGVGIGGGIFTYQAALTGSGITFTNNTAQAGNSTGNGSYGGLHADSLGGAAGFQPGSAVTLTNITATGNKAVGGGAGNSADSKGGAGLGGAIHGERSTVSISGGLFQGNSAIGGSAATGGEGFGGALMMDNTPFTLDKARVIANVARSGGSSTNSKVGAPGGGGAYMVSFNGASIQGSITNSIFAKNSLVLGTPGVTKPRGSGAGLTIQGISVQIVHSTFASNEFTDDNSVTGQAIMVFGQNGTSGVPGIATIRYSIISDHIHTNTAASAVTVPTNSPVNNRVDLDNVLFVNNTNNTNQNGIPYAPGTINQSNVKTSNTPVGYVSAGSPNYNYHLAAGSAAIDAAAGSTTTVDIDGEVRPIGSAPDLGADEFMRPTLQTSKSIMMMVDGQSSSTLRQRITLYPDSGGSATWTATTNASWLYLGESGTNRTMSGKTGEELVVRVATKGLENKTYDGSIVLTSPSADGITITVQVIKVGTLYKLHLPTLSKR